MLLAKIEMEYNLVISVVESFEILMENMQIIFMLFNRMKLCKQIFK